MGPKSSTKSTLAIATVLFGSRNLFNSRRISFSRNLSLVSSSSSSRSFWSKSSNSALEDPKSSIKPILAMAAILFDFCDLFNFRRISFSRNLSIISSSWSSRSPSLELCNCSLGAGFRSGGCWCALLNWRWDWKPGGVGSRGCGVVVIVEEWPGWNGVFRFILPNGCCEMRMLLRANFKVFMCPRRGLDLFLCGCDWCFKLADCSE